MKVLAVVIGSNEYFEGCKLDNPINDAEGMADIFGRLGYEVILMKNINTENIIHVLEDYEKRIDDFDASIFYFAGHGFQVDGENYLASIDCQVANPTKAHCARTCIRLTEVLDIIKKSNNKVNIVIIDACRKSFDRGGSSNFSPIHAPKGTLIAFSTSTGDGAKDYGFEGHSIYTGALLKYIGRERLSVEELFKKVRKTVFNLSEGSQTTWEHTSLTGDFYFNTGQLVHSIVIPYDEDVVKDRTYIDKGDAISRIINDLASSNWDMQNPAMDRFIKLDPPSINKNQQFIIGRNILQSVPYAFSVQHFFEDLRRNLNRYSVDGKNHVLNGILFEMYFDNNGDFRNGNFKQHYTEVIFQLRKYDEFKTSFEFIRKALQPYIDQLIYLPGDDNIIDVDVLASPQNFTDPLGKPSTSQVIEQITVHGQDITEKICENYDIWRKDEAALKTILSHYLFTPVDLIQVNPNMSIKSISYKAAKVDTW